MAWSPLLVPRAVWGSLTPPRLVSLLASLTYACLAAGGVAVLTRPGPLPCDVALGAGAMILGGAVAVPSAWLGWWGVETPAAALTLVGMGAVTTMGLARALLAEQWPGWHLWTALALSLMIVQRMLWIWGRWWEPGREPHTRLRREEIRLIAARTLAADILAAHERLPGEGASADEHPS